jgi:hypothetical protein
VGIHGAAYSYMYVHLNVKYFAAVFSDGTMKERVKFM